MHNGKASRCMAPSGVSAPLPLRKKGTRAASAAALSPDDGWQCVLSAPYAAAQRLSPLIFSPSAGSQSMRIFLLLVLPCVALMDRHTRGGCVLMFRNPKDYQKAQELRVIGGNLLKWRIEEADHTLGVRTEKGFKEQGEKRETSQARERVIQETPVRAEPSGAALQ